MSNEAKHTLRAANIARQAEWDADNRISLSYRGNELAGEVGEACNIIKKLDRERLGIRGSRATREQLAEELADVVICADLIAMHEDIDLLGGAVPAKFNATSEKVGLTTRLSPDEATRRLLVECESFLTRINQLASPNPERTFDNAITDLGYVADYARATLAAISEHRKANP